MTNTHTKFKRKLLSAVIASTITATASGAGDEVISTDTTPSPQFFDSTSTSITVTSTGIVDTSSFTLPDYEDGIALDGGGHNLSTITVEQGGRITASWDAIYTGDEGANTIGSINIDGVLFATGIKQGIGLSIDGDTTVTGDVTIGSTAEIIAAGTGDCESGLDLDCGVVSSAVALFGRVDGSIINRADDANLPGAPAPILFGLIGANGIMVGGGIDAATGDTLGPGSVGGDIINTGNIAATSQSGEADGGGIWILGGATVEGDIINDGQIVSDNGAAGIRVTSAAINVVQVDGIYASEDVDGLVSGSLQTSVNGSIINNGDILTTFDGIALNDNVTVGGDIINNGLIDVSTVPDGDAAAILIGDDDDLDAGLPTVSGVIRNNGTLISDTTLETDDNDAPLTPALRIATVVLDSSGPLIFENTSSGVITNNDSQGKAIESTGATDEVTNDGIITGNIFMNGGLVVNNGTINGTTNMAGGTFASDGGTSGEILGASSLVAGHVGNGLMTTTINGNLTFSGELAAVATAESGLGFTSNGQFDVTGNADITGATVAVLLTSGSVTAEGDEFVLLSAGDTLTSDATTAEGIDLVSFTSVVGFTVEQRGNDLFVIAGASDFTSPIDDVIDEAGLTGTTGADNVNNVAEALNDVPLDEVESGSELDQVLGNLQSSSLTDEEKVVALTTLDPDTVESASVGALSADTAAAGTVNNRIAALRGYYGFSGAVAGDPMGIHGFWVQAYDNETDQSTRDGVDGFDADTFGFAAGFDGALSENVNAGLAFSYADTDVEGKLESNEMSIDSYRLAAYGSYNAETYYLDGQVAYAMNEYDTERVIDANLSSSGQGFIATGDHDGDQYSLRLRGGYPIATESGWYITPKAEMDYTYLEEDGYTEQGAGNAGLKVESQDVEVFIVGVGVKFAYPITTESETTWIPELSLDYLYDFIGDEVEVDSNFIGVSGGGFITSGADVEQEMYKASVRLRAFGQGNFSFSGGFDYIEKDDYDSQSIMATVRYDF